MFINVKNEEERGKFERLVQESWNDYGLKYESHGGEKFLILNKEGVVVGTIEMCHYQPQKSFVDKWFPYYKDDLISQQNKKVVQISNVSIQAAHRGQKNLERILAMIYRFGQWHNIEYFIGLMEPMFYKSLKIHYKLPINKIGKLVRLKHYPVVPIVINFQQFKSDKKQEDLIELLRELTNSKVW